MAKVYFLKIHQKTPEILKEAGIKVSKFFTNFFGPKDSVAIKIHFGERVSQTYLNPLLVESIYNQLKGKVKRTVLTDCNVLYKSDRSFGTTHKKLAEEHGFGFAPIIIADGERGENELKVKINQKHFKEAKLGGVLKDFNALLAITHFTGHGGTGFGGALKNVGMGLGSKGGKLAMHQAFKLVVDLEKCQGCFSCQKECPGEAIFEEDGKAQMNYQKCLGCGICISVCPFGAIKTPQIGTSGDLQERIAEYVLGVLKNRKAFFVNVLLDITPKCDCFRDKVQKPMVPDIGILISEDIVAIDQASVDLVGKKNLETETIDPTVQLEYAQSLGLGKRRYAFVEIN